MKPFLCLRILPGAAGIGLFLLPLGSVASEPAKTSNSGERPAQLLRESTSHDYYAKLAKLSGEPSAANLPIDAQRYPNQKDRLEEILSHKPFYLTVPITTFEVGPPPANSSARTRAELDYLLRLQEQRTPMEMAVNLDFQNWGYVVTAKPTDRDFSDLRANFFRVGRSMGTWFNADKLPKTAEFVARAWQDIRFYMWSLKAHYSRMRPYQLEPKLKNLQETDWPAYPSGHATFAYMLAYLYSAISPEHSSIFLHDAYVIGHSREIIGVHFPSDTEAGQLLAKRFIELTLKNEAFAEDLKAVRAEWESAARDYP